MTNYDPSNEAVCKLSERSVIYNTNIIDAPEEVLFNPGSAQLNRSAGRSRKGLGRAMAIYFKYRSLNLVLKHYFRGGMIAAVLFDQYPGLNPKNSRSFREWRLLNKMQQMGLPVPVPVAASVIQRGIFYRADLVTQEIEQATTLADRLRAGKLQDQYWRAIGKCLRQFHDASIYHADLNARNILLTEDNEVYLIDFDKGAERYLGDSWKASNLARLNRSLNKFKQSSRAFNFNESCWEQLLIGYSV